MENTAVQAYHFTLESAIAEWIATTSTAHSHSKRTEKAYHDTMTAFRAFLQASNYDLLSNPVDIARVATLWADMRFGKTRRPGQPVSSSTYNQRLAILSSFYTFLKNQYKLDIPNPIEAIKKPKVQAYAAATPLAEEEATSGLESIDTSTVEGMRDYAILALALATGRRASELVGLRWEHVKITGKKAATRLIVTFHCKGKKIMLDELDPETSGVILDYLHAQYGTKNVMHLPADTPLWVSYSHQNSGEGISARTLSNICMRYFGTSKVHTLRHTFSDAMIESGAPITELGDRLGHTSIVVTQRYAQKLRSAKNPYSPKLTARFGIHRKQK